MDYNFTFTTDDCIKARQAVMRFCNAAIPSNGRKVPNCIDDKDPYKDVISDFQTIMYIQFICLGMEQAKLAQTELPMRHKAKQFHTQMLRCWESVRRIIPLNDITFVSLYADVDDVIYDRLTTLATQTYYTICNSMLQCTHNANSEQVHALARLTAGYIFTEMGISMGLQKAHNVDTRQLIQLPNSIMRLTSAIIHEQQKDVKLDDGTLEKAVDDAMKIVINTCQPILEAVGEHAQKLDLAPYVATADITLTNLNKIVAARKRAMTKKVSTIKKK